MKLQMSDECSAIIDNFCHQYSSRDLVAGVALNIKNPDYNGFVIFAVDAQSESRAAAHAIDVPTDLASAQNWFAGWVDEAGIDAFATTREMVDIKVREILDQDTLSGCLSCWIVAYLYEQGLSLEEQVELSGSNARLFLVQGSQCTICHSKTGSRASTFQPLL